MKTTMIALTAATLLVVTPTRAEEEEAGEKIVSVSPDKKFAVRIKYDPTSTSAEEGQPEEISRDATKAIELVAMPSKEVVLNLMTEEGGLDGKGVWAQDSSWFAYALSLGQRVTETRVCHRKEDSFEQLNTENLYVDSGGDTRNQYIRPIKWLNPGTLVLEQMEIFRGGAGDSTLQFTVHFDKDGKFHVISKKKVKSKRE